MLQICYLIYFKIYFQRLIVTIKNLKDLIIFESSGEQIHLPQAPGPPTKKRNSYQKIFLYLLKNLLFKQKSFSRPFERTDHLAQLPCSPEKKKFLPKKFHTRFENPMINPKK